MLKKLFFCHVPIPKPLEPDKTPAIILLISGAPLPSAKNVTPATFGERFNARAISVSAGQKFASAVSLNK